LPLRSNFLANIPDDRLLQILPNRREKR